MKAAELGVRALALGLSVAAGAARAQPRVRAEAGAGFDTNITRAETPEDRRGGSVLRTVLDLDDQRGLGPLTAHVSYQAGAKAFPETPGEDVVFQRLSARLGGRLGEMAHLGLGLAAQDRTTRDPLRPRDYARLNGGPELSARLGPVTLGLQLGAERLSFKPDDRFSASGLGGALSARGAHGPWTLDGNLGLQQRRFDGTRLVALGPQDPADAVWFIDPSSGRSIGLDPAGGDRQDVVLSLGGGLRYAGAALLSVEYGFVRNRSDSFNGSFDRHELQASATTPLPGGLLLSAKLSLQRLTYADGIFISPLEILDDENRSAITGRLEWPLWDLVSVVASGGAWFSPFGTGADFERYVGLLGLAFNDG